MTCYFILADQLVYQGGFYNDNRYKTLYMLNVKSQG